MTRKSKKATPAFTPTHITLKLSELLTAWELSENHYYFCSLAAHLQTARASQAGIYSLHFNPVTDTDKKTHAEFYRIMPAYIRAPETLTHYPSTLLGWLQNLPEKLEKVRTGKSPREFRTAFLEWAVLEFNNPLITFHFS